MKTLTSLIGLMLITLSSHSQKQDKVTAALNSLAEPLVTTNPDSSMADLQFLKKAIGDRKIVAMGEATHGTREFFEMKDRTFRYLVQEMGFRVFAIEASLPECRAVNDYVMYGKGEIQSVIDTMYFWTWNTHEVKNLINWMKEYNVGKENADKVRFVGFDMQHTHRLAQDLIKFMKSYYPEDHRFDVLLDSLNHPGYFPPMADSLVTIKYAMAPQLKELVLNSKERIIEKEGNEAYVALKQDVVVLAQHYLFELEASPIKKFRFGHGGVRDSSMAENVKLWLEDLPANTKMFVWAHNGHVTQRPMFSYNTQGFWLNKMYGDNYYVIGFDFNRGSFVARDDKKDLRIHNVSTVEKDWTAAYFSKADADKFFLDLKKAADNKKLAEVVNEKRFSRSIGALFVSDREKIFTSYEKLCEAYDALIYVDSTNHSVMNRHKLIE